MSWRYTNHGYDIEISDLFNGDLSQLGNYYRTSRQSEPPKSRPIPIWNGDAFWGDLWFGIKINKDAGDAHRAGYTASLGTGVWVKGWICLITDGGWQTAWGARWFSKLNGVWQDNQSMPVVYQGIYEGRSLGNDRLIDCKRRLEIGETLGSDPNDPTWLGEAYIFASDDDANVFSNRVPAPSISWIEINSAIPHVI